MTNRRLEQLVEHRTVLMAQAAVERAQLSAAAEPLRRSLAVADQGLAAARRIARYPLLLAGAVAVAAVLRPRRVAGWLHQGFRIWRTTQAVKQHFARR